jgi:hypothetical protein
MSGVSSVKDESYDHGSTFSNVGDTFKVTCGIRLHLHFSTSAELLVCWLAMVL